MSSHTKSLQKAVASGWTQRVLTCHDAEALARLEKACFAQAWSSEQFVKALGGTSFLAVGIFIQPRLVAYVTGILIEPEAEIVNLAVIQKMRARGIGSLALRFFLQQAVLLGIGLVHLEVRVDNHAARALYRGCGFVLQGRRKAYYPDGQDALLLSWDAAYEIF